MKSWGTALLEGTGGGEGPLTDLTTVNPNGIPLSTLTLDDIATAMARGGGGGKVAIREEMVLI